MRIVSKINSDVLQSRTTKTTADLEHLFQTVPNMPAKTIRLYPQNSLSMFTEGLGQIYNIKGKGDNFEGINDRKYKWKMRGHSFPKVTFATRSTGGAIGAGTSYGGQGQEFVVAFKTSSFNPRDIVKLKNGDKLYVVSHPTFISAGVFEYTVKVQSSVKGRTILGAHMVLGQFAGLAGNAYPELSDRGYISAQMAAEEHVNYLTKVRYDWNWSADAASTKYVIEDIINHNGKAVKQNYITDQLWMQALEQYHFNKEMELIYGETSMGPDGRCHLQDEKGQDIVKGDGFINQIADSRKSTYNTLTLDYVEDILMDMARKMPKSTGNTILMSTGLKGYNTWGKLMRTEHKSWDTSGSKFVRTRAGGKIQLGAEYDSYTFQGNTIVVSPNKVFDHPANVSGLDSDGDFLESSKMMFIDTSSYDGTPNLKLIAKEGRSFVTGEMDGIGGQDGKTSGKVSQLLDGSAKSIIGTMGLIVHNSESSVILDKV
jgi:hypothetical protein